MKKLFLPLLFIACIGCNDYEEQFPVPESIELPKTKASNFTTTDSSFLQLTVKGDAFEIDFLKNRTLVNNLSMLDSFLQKNKQFINTKKVIITGLDTTKPNSNLGYLLQKYGIARAMVNSN